MRNGFSMQKNFQRFVLDMGFSLLKTDTEQIQKNIVCIRCTKPFENIETVLRHWSHPDMNTSTKSEMSQWISSRWFKLFTARGMLAACVWQWLNIVVVKNDG